MKKIFEDQELIYEGNDLGTTYQKENTVFKVWSPIAEEMKVVVYNNYDDQNGKIYPMAKGQKGVWELKLNGDYQNQYYNYRVTIDGIEKETPDPYTKGATVNGSKGMIVDFESLNPKGWEEHKIPQSIPSTEAIIYEMHVRDFSIAENSGMINKGKYLAFTEEGAQTPEGSSTGLDHLVELGITHIHLLPVFDFHSVDENKGGYNWGYDPYLYNVPEGSYATNPYDGRVRITEFKQMVKALHEKGIRVVMDVVYNHTYTVEESPFHLLMPNYYYRTDEEGKYTNGSGCGNETASERPMMRKFIIDSLMFWASEYKIDGFRFDLMAVHDIETMLEVERELRKVNPSILLYGEPWNGGHSALPIEKRFTKGSQKGLGIAVFNDDIRDAIKGDTRGIEAGFVNGELGMEEKVKRGIVGSIQYDDTLYGFAQEPGESITYFSAHDDLCLFDKIEKTSPACKARERERMNRLAFSIMLTSQGIPFIHGGTEFLRTKYGNPNTYNMGDEVNQIVWNRKKLYKETYEYIKELIALRKSQKVMMLSKAEEIRKSLTFIETPRNMVAYLLTSSYEKDFNHIFIIHNANRHEMIMKLPSEGQWKVIANEYEVNKEGVQRGVQSFSLVVEVAPLSTYILCKN